eukprot:CFRG4131T1
MFALRRAVQSQARRIPLRAAEEPAASQYRNGFLFNEKPGARKKERWEYIWVYGMGGAFVFAAVGLWNVPDTSMDTFANEEIKRRALEIQKRA